jgi:hypothetical protein
MRLSSKSFWKVMRSASSHLVMDIPFYPYLPLRIIKESLMGTGAQTLAEWDVMLLPQ